MYQFFVSDEQIEDGKILITGGDVNHISRALRMKPGEKVRVSSASGRAFFCHVEKLGEREVTVCVDEEDTQGTELSNRIYLFQGLPKGDKMEMVIQKAVELGACEIVPVAMKNCVVRLDAKRAEGKARRWQAIAESAAKQSRRSIIPRVQMPLPWSEAKALAESMDVCLVPYEHERGMEATREVLRSIGPGQSVAVMIGPEGGFAEEEISGLSEKMHRISLGRRILRTETAGMAALAMLAYELEDF